MDYKYNAFISYRHASLDMTTAKTLHSLIEQYRVPKALRKDGRKKLGIVFRDQDELPASSNLNEKICQALDNTEYLIVICTPNTPQSPWVERETWIETLEQLAELFCREKERRETPDDVLLRRMRRLFDEARGSTELLAAIMEEAP